MKKQNKTLVLLVVLPVMGVVVSAQVHAACDYKKLEQSLVDRVFAESAQGHQSIQDARQLTKAEAKKKLQEMQALQEDMSYLGDGLLVQGIKNDIASEKVKGSNDVKSVVWEKKVNADQKFNKEIASKFNTAQKMTDLLTEIAILKAHADLNKGEMTVAEIQEHAPLLSVLDVQLQEEGASSLGLSVLAEVISEKVQSNAFCPKDENGEEKYFSYQQIFGHLVKVLSPVKEVQHVDGAKVELEATEEVSAVKTKVKTAKPRKTSKKTKVAVAAPICNGDIAKEIAAAKKIAAEVDVALESFELVAAPVEKKQGRLSRFIFGDKKNEKRY